MRALVKSFESKSNGALALIFGLVTFIYWPGLSGSWLFDDYPNIVDNKGVQPSGWHIATLLNAALSSPASELKRPLASLSFAANYLISGLDPFWMKLTNLVIHLINGFILYFLCKALFDASRGAALKTGAANNNPAWNSSSGEQEIFSLLLTAAWLLLPINLTSVLYVVQRMESLANVFVLAGLLGYIRGRTLMLRTNEKDTEGFYLCLGSLVASTALGLLAKETAALLPLYALITEWCLFRFASHPTAYHKGLSHRDRRIIAAYMVLLALPLILGLWHLLPTLLTPRAWATRDFTLRTRLLSEARAVSDYIQWIIIPTPRELSFYHDDFEVSTSLLSPPSTLASIFVLVSLGIFSIWARSKKPFVSLGILLFLSSQLLTGTVVPLELVYEHRNYFGSFALLLALAALFRKPIAASLVHARCISIPEEMRHGYLPRSLIRTALVFSIMTLAMTWWLVQTATTAYAWGNPLRLAQELASRNPQSPRAQYELGRTYIIYSRYDPSSPFRELAYSALEQASTLPKSSILPEQALIFMNARMGLPSKDQWWEAMIAKLRAKKPDVQDESSLASLTACSRQLQCELPRSYMESAFKAALSHPDPSARLLATYSDYAWNILGDQPLGKRMLLGAIRKSPDEPAYLMTLYRMQVTQGLQDDARDTMDRLRQLDLGGRLDHEISELPSTR